MQYSHSLFHFIKFHSGCARWPKQQKNDLTHWLWITACWSGSSKVPRVETVSCYFALVIYNTCRDGRRRHWGPSFWRPHGYHTETSHFTEAATLKDPLGLAVFHGASAEETRLKWLKGQLETSEMVNASLCSPTAAMCSLGERQSGWKASTTPTEGL